MNVIERAKAYVNTCNRDGFGCKCEARVSAECGCSGVKWASAGESASIITDLLSIAERLPKDAEGNPIVPGVDTVWHTHLGETRECRTEAAGFVWVNTYTNTDQSSHEYGRFCTTEHLFRYDLCYPTRAAAEAARKE